MKSTVSIIATLCLALGCCLGGAFGQGPEDLVESQDVFVLVSTHNGWGKYTTTALSCDGRFRIVGAYGDTTTIRGVASLDTAVSFINDLLAINFFDQPKKFKSSRTQLVQVDRGIFAEQWQETMDAGSTKIELHVGKKVHAVVLVYPAYGAPEQLIDWINRFDLYMKELRGW
jgi:hypothetical protein